MNAEGQKLLALAAKAASLDVEMYAGEGPFKGKMMRRITPKPAPPGSERKVWNPLEDDGDAFRLAVQLGIGFIPDYEVGEVNTTYMVGRLGFNTTEEFENNPLPATRRAIVRAAAAIGEQS